MSRPEDCLVVALFLLGAVVLLPGLAIAAPFFALALWLMGVSERD